MDLFAFAWTAVSIFFGWIIGASFDRSRSKKKMSDLQGRVDYWRNRSQDHARACYMLNENECLMDKRQFILAKDLIEWAELEINCALGLEKNDIDELSKKYLRGIVQAYRKVIIKYRGWI